MLLRLSCCIVYICIFILRSYTTQAQHLFSLGSQYYIPNHPSFPDFHAPAIYLDYFGLSRTSIFSKPQIYPCYTIGGVFHGKLAVLGFAGYSQIGISIPLSPRWTVSAHTGLAYHSKRYDSAHNPSNIAIGSHITNISSLKFAYTFSKVFYSHIFFTHYSNGGVRTMNTGLNGIGLAIGYLLPCSDRYDSSTAYFSKIKYKKWQHVTSINIGAQSTSTDRGSIYPTYDISHSLHFRYHKIFSSGFTVGAIHDKSIMDRLTLDEHYNRNRWIHASMLYLSFSHSIALRHISLHTYLGYYIHNTSLSTHKLITRFSISYDINKDKINIPLSVQAGVHAHMGVADYTYIGLVYKW